MTLFASIKEKLLPTKQPALPIAPTIYSVQHQDQFSNTLRLYFNQIDADFAGLLSNAGGRFLSFPHIAAASNIDQFAPANNVATKVLWDTLDSGLGFTLNPNNTATADYSGIYKIDYSLQFANTDQVTHYVYVWLEINGVNVVGSSSKFSVPARKSAGFDGYLVAYSSVTFTLNAGDSVALYWATEQARIVSTATDGVYMEVYPAQTIGTPPNTASIPSNPSAIGSIVFVSGLTA